MQISSFTKLFINKKHSVLEYYRCIFWSITGTSPLARDFLKQKNVIMYHFSSIRCYCWISVNAYSWHLTYNSMAIWNATAWISYTIFSTHRMIKRYFAFTLIFFFLCLQIFPIFGPCSNSPCWLSCFGSIQNSDKEFLSKIIFYNTLNKTRKIHINDLISKSKFTRHQLDDLQHWKLTSFSRKSALHFHS